MTTHKHIFIIAIAALCLIPLLVAYCIGSQGYALLFSIISCLSIYAFAVLVFFTGDDRPKSDAP